MSVVVVVFVPIINTEGPKARDALQLHKSDEVSTAETCKMVCWFPFTIITDDH